MVEAEKKYKLETTDEQRKVLLIYNPNSGNGMFPRYLDLIISKFQDKGFLIRPVRGASTDILDYVFSHIHAEQYRNIIIAGGDGTVNIVVNAMMKHEIDLPIAIFPAGTANDFAYYMNIPNEIYRAWKRICLCRSGKDERQALYKCSSYGHACGCFSEN